MILVVADGRSEVFSIISKLKATRFIFFPYQFIAYSIGKELSGGLGDYQFTTIEELANYSSPISFLWNRADSSHKQMSPPKGRQKL